MKIYLDTANLTEVKELTSFLPVSGVTTNPSIAARSGVPLKTLLPQLRDTLGSEGLIFAQVISDTAEKIVEEAKQIHSYTDNVVIKIPVNKPGLIAMKELTKSNIRVLGTAVYTVTQGVLAGLSGAEFVAPYVNRIEMLSGNSIKTVQTINQLLKLHTPDCSVLAASFKNTQQVIDCMVAGCDSVTIPSDLAYKLLDNPAVDQAILQFQTDWQKSFGTLEI